jgi:hypothetical protein
MAKAPIKRGYCEACGNQFFGESCPFCRAKAQQGAESVAKQSAPIDMANAVADVANTMANKPPADTAPKAPATKTSTVRKGGGA